jgi:uncharacterized protein DUF5681
MADLTVVGNSGPSTKPGGITGKGFLPGQSGNPSGRPKRKPLSDALLAALAKPSRKRGYSTQLEVAMANLVRIMCYGKGKEAVEAFKLAMSYTDGLPIQTVEIDVYDAARREAEARGLDPDKVVSILEGLRQRRTA